MRYSMVPVITALLAIHATANAAVITFATDPFQGSAALTTPGRQIVGGELFTDFSIASDVFELDPLVFGIGDEILFANGLVGDLPTSNVNVIVLQTLDNDGNPATPFGAGNAANLIAERVTSPGAGFFLYFNSSLDLPRLVFSTDLNDNTADLKILARLTNLGGQSGRDALPLFSAANFAIRPVPEPASFLPLMIWSGAFWAGRKTLWRRRALTQA